MNKICFQYSGKSLVNPFFPLAFRFSLLIFKIIKRIARLVPAGIILFSYELSRLLVFFLFYKIELRKENTKLHNIATRIEPDTFNVYIILFAPSFPKDWNAHSLKGVKDVFHFPANELHKEGSACLALLQGLVSEEKSLFLFLEENDDLFSYTPAVLIQAAIKEPEAKAYEFGFIKKHLAGIETPSLSGIVPSSVEGTPCHNNYCLPGSQLNAHIGQIATVSALLEKSITDPARDLKKLSFFLLKKKNPNPLFISPQGKATSSDKVSGKISIIIPTRNKADLVKTCIESIFQKSTYHDIEVVLVDNGSDEQELKDYVEALKRNYPGKFKCLLYPEPFNFSAINNFAVQYSESRFVLFLNNDTEVISADWLEQMATYASLPHIGAVGPKLLYKNKLIQHVGVVMGGNEWCDHLFAGHSRYSFFSEIINKDNYFPALTAACIMVERSKFDAVGGFDTSFSVEYNDIDLCLQLRARGWDSLMLPRLQLYHYESATRGYFGHDPAKFNRHLVEKKLFGEKWSKYLDRSKLISDTRFFLFMRLTK